MKKINPTLHGITENKAFNIELLKVAEDNDFLEYKLSIKANIADNLEPIKVAWTIPAINIKGVWKPSIHSLKRVQYDWELEHSHSRLCIDSPVISLYGHNDENLCTFSTSETIHPVEMNALYREEDNLIYCHIEFFKEQKAKVLNSEIYISVDLRNNSFAEALQGISKWWDKFDHHSPMKVPPHAKKPFYSTWYQYHQNLDEKTLLEEFKIAKELGFETVIIDDGWQTMDQQRGYDFTGDWHPDRIPEMKKFVSQIHDLGLKVLLWYSVPFCGKKSAAYHLFKDKLLTDAHRWAPVFDPRYPEVRAYLTNIYTNALKEWGLDGFKLDFIDEFKNYETTVLTKQKGMDYDSIDEAVDTMMTQAVKEMLKINPSIMIEFRQQYTGPGIRKFGNMFRAFDCPNDSDINRVRTTKLRLLNGESAIHSDPLTWNVNEPVEIIALQFWNVLFSVPQFSMELKSLPEPQFKSVSFYLSFWRKHFDVLMHGEFNCQNPYAKYPILSSTKDDTIIVGIYDRMVFFALDCLLTNIYIVNATTNNTVVINNKLDIKEAVLTTLNCVGETLNTENINLSCGMHNIPCPSSGLLRIELRAAYTT